MTISEPTHPHRHRPSHTTTHTPSHSSVPTYASTVAGHDVISPLGTVHGITEYTNPPLAQKNKASVATEQGGAGNGEEGTAASLTHAIYVDRESGEVVHGTVKSAATQTYKKQAAVTDSANKNIQYGSDVGDAGEPHEDTPPLTDSRVVDPSETVHTAHSLPGRDVHGIHHKNNASSGDTTAVSKIMASLERRTNSLRRQTLFKHMVTGSSTPNPLAESRDEEDGNERTDAAGDFSGSTTQHQESITSTRNPTSITLSESRDEGSGNERTDAVGDSSGTTTQHQESIASTQNPPSSTLSESRDEVSSAERTGVKCEPPGVTCRTQHASTGSQGKRTRLRGFKVRHPNRSRCPNTQHSPRCPVTTPAPPSPSQGQGRLPQFSPASRLRFVLRKRPLLRRHKHRQRPAQEVTTRKVLPQFNPASGIKFFLSPYGTQKPVGQQQQSEGNTNPSEPEENKDQDDEAKTDMTKVTTESTVDDIRERQKAADNSDASVVTKHSTVPTMMADSDFMEDSYDGDDRTVTQNRMTSEVQQSHASASRAQPSVSLEMHPQNDRDSTVPSEKSPEDEDQPTSKPFIQDDEDYKIYTLATNSEAKIVVVDAKANSAETLPERLNHETENFELMDESKLNSSIIFRAKSDGSNGSLMDNPEVNKSITTVEDTGDCRGGECMPDKTSIQPNNSRNNMAVTVSDGVGHNGNLTVTIQDMPYSTTGDLNSPDRGVISSITADEVNASSLPASYTHKPAHGVDAVSSGSTIFVVMSSDKTEVGANSDTGNTTAVHYHLGKYYTDVATTSARDEEAKDTTKGYASTQTGGANANSRSNSMHRSSEVVLNDTSNDMSSETSTLQGNPNSETEDELHNDFTTKTMNRSPVPEMETRHTSVVYQKRRIQPSNPDSPGAETSESKLYISKIKATPGNSEQHPVAEGTSRGSDTNTRSGNPQGPAYTVKHGPDRTRTRVFKAPDRHSKRKSPHHILQLSPLHRPPGEQIKSTSGTHTPRHTDRHGITPHTASVPLHPARKEERGQASKADFLETLPQFLRGSVHIDRADMGGLAGVAVSSGYGNVYYQGN